MLLAIDTATTTASLALYDPIGDRLLGEWTWQARRRQTQDVLSAATTLLAQFECQPGDVDRLAVTTGPGSFTGVRIGISLVKGMALGLERPPRVVGIPTLRVTAQPWLKPAAAGPTPARVCAYIQAGRGRYNWVIFAPDGSPQLPVAEDHGVGVAEEFAAVLARESMPVWLVGESTVELVEAVAQMETVTLLDDVSSLRRASHLACLAATAIAAGQDGPLADLRPLYLRKPG